MTRPRCAYCRNAARPGYETCSSHKNVARLRIPPTPAGLPILNSYMVTGDGFRVESCATYDQCVTAASRREGPACCPRGCEAYAPAAPLDITEWATASAAWVLPAPGGWA